MVINNNNNNTNNSNSNNNNNDNNIMFNVINGHISISISTKIRHKYETMNICPRQTQNNSNHKLCVITYIYIYICFLL